MRDDDRLTIDLDPGLREGLDDAARAAGQTREEFVRKTLAARVAKPRKKPAASPNKRKTTTKRKTKKKPESAYDIFVRMGWHRLRPGKKLPPDLSTNPKYMEGFGL